MKRDFKTALYSLSLVLLLSAPALAGQVADVGAAAPDFTLTAQHGGSYTLSNYQGQVVLLMMIGYA